MSKNNTMNLSTKLINIKELSRLTGIKNLYAYIRRNVIVGLSHLQKILIRDAIIRNCEDVNELNLFELAINYYNIKPEKLDLTGYILDTFKDANFDPYVKDKYYEEGDLIKFKFEYLNDFIGYEGCGDWVNDKACLLEIDFFHNLDCGEEKEMEIYYDHEKIENYINKL